jgi:hypothetical protein
MAGEKQTGTVSRAEFCSTVAMLSLFPAILFLAAGGKPDTLLGQIGAGIVLVAMLVMSFAYSMMAIRERGRQSKADRGNGPEGPADRSLE